VELLDAVQHVFSDTKSSFAAFGPELTLCATILVMLLVRLFDALRWLDAFYIALIGTVLALVNPLGEHPPWQILADPSMIEPRELFTGLLVYDSFTVFLRAVLTLFAVLFVIFTKLSGVPESRDGTDVYTMVLGATVGMCIMASANHLLSIFVGVEMASVPSYALAGLLRGRRISSEAALKYSVYGAGAAGVMLYGISLLAGLFNTAHLPSLAVALAQKFQAGIPAEESMVLILAALMVMVGLAFKLSAVPFHFWCPDVFEGATAEVNAFLSVASKATALALLVRVAVGFSVVPDQTVQEPPKEEATQVAAEDPHVPQSSFVSVEKHAANETDRPDAEKSIAAEARQTQPAAAGLSQAALAIPRGFIAKLIAFIAVITCTFGNLAAYGQTNIKRLMAYSTIAHAGYMMMPISAAIAVSGSPGPQATAAVASVALYIVIYLFTNLAAFAAVAFVRNRMGTEEIADYAGMVKRNPGLVVWLSLMMFSLLGLPPLAGFLAKFAIFAAIVDAYRLTGGTYLILLVVAGSINTALSLFYYLRVVKVMALDPEPEGRPPATFSMVSLQGTYLWLVALPVVLLILNWQGLSEWSLHAAEQIFP